MSVAITTPTLSEGGTPHDTEHLDTRREGEIIAWGGGSQMTGGGLVTYLQVVGGVRGKEAMV